MVKNIISFIALNIIVGASAVGIVHMLKDYHYDIEYVVKCSELEQLRTETVVKIRDKYNDKQIIKALENDINRKVGWYHRQRGCKIIMNEMRKIEEVM